MRKPKDWGQLCPNPDCSHHRLINRGNISAIATYLSQSGKRRIFRCSKCEHIPSDLVVDGCPHMLRAAQPLISR
jgi:hypothetical protein